jgi:hypothetical protein
MGARLCLHTGGGRATVMEKPRQSSRVSDAGPWAEAAHQVRTLGANRVPECGGCRFEEVRSPYRNGQHAGWAYQPPQLRDRGGHVGQEEDAEDTHDRVE